jgi:hypothetical protein
MKARNLVQNEVYIVLSNIEKLLKDEHLHSLHGIVTAFEECSCIIEEECREECLDCEGLGEIEDNREVMSYVAVSDWLAGRLRAYQETVVEIECLNIWHRTEGNQAIEADSVMQKIADDLKFI